jgi:hypothetical protein
MRSIKQLIFQIILQRILDIVEEVAVSAHDKAAPGNEYKVRNAKPKTATVNTSLPLDYLTVNSHFYNTPVNVSYSSVHVPTYVYDRGKSMIYNYINHFKIF